MTQLAPLDWREAGIGPGHKVPTALRVTADNWRTYPFSRWAFQHVDQLVPVVPLARSRGSQSIVEDTGPIEQALHENFDLAGCLRDLHCDALVVLEHGRLRLARFGNGMGPSRSHMTFSITKSVVGLVAELLIARGAVEQGATVAHLLPELAASAFGPATLRQLLDMTDGVSFDEGYDDPGSAVHRYSSLYWAPPEASAGVLDALAGFTTRAAAPGTRFCYRTPVADLVGLLLQRATGQRLSQLVSDLVWRPAGCADRAFMLRDRAGMEIGGTGLNASAMDLARLGHWLLAPDQARLLGVIARGSDRRLFAAAGHYTRPHGSFRSLWWIDHRRPRALTANGVFGQRLHIVPARGLVIVTLGSHPLAGNCHTDLRFRALARAIGRALSRSQERAGTPTQSPPSIEENLA